MSELFSKIPNNIWHSDGLVFQGMGGRDGFLLYAFITSRKGLDNKVYVTMNQLMDTLRLCSHKNRHKERLRKGLLALEAQDFLSVDDVMQGVNDTMVIDWEDKFDRKTLGWTPFFAGDFELYERVGEIPYLIMWILRMFKNHKTKTSFVSISSMADLIECKRNSVQGAVNLFRDSGLFKVATGEYYHSKTVGRRIRENNEYTYMGDREGIMSMSNDEIKLLLNR